MAQKLYNISGGATLKIHLGVMVLLAFLLVACGSDSAPVDPYIGMVLAEQASDSAAKAAQFYDAAIKSTQSQLASKGTELAIDEKRIEAEVRGTQYAIEHQATAVSIEQTQQAPAIAIQMVQATVYAEQTQAAIQAPVVTATAQALVAAAKVNDSRAYREQVMSYVVPLGVTFLFLSGGVMFFFVGLDLGAWFIERDKMRQARYDSQFGFTTYDYDSGRWVLESPSDKYRQLPRPRRSEVTLSPGGVTAVSTPGEYSEQDELTEEVRQFLYAAADVNGKEAHVLPSNDRMGLETHRWTKAVNALKSVEVVRTRPGVGTYLTGNRTIGKVLYQLDTDELRLTPPPPRDVPWQR